MARLLQSFLYIGGAAHLSLVTLSLSAPSSSALGSASSVFGPSDSEVVRIGLQLDAGMLSCNDFATCYMCHSSTHGRSQRFRIRQVCRD